MTTKKLEEERAHHAWLDKIAGKCGALTQAGETHLHCEYCAYLCDYYGCTRVRLQLRGGES